MKTVMAIVSSQEIKEQLVRSLGRDYGLYLCGSDEDGAVLRRFKADALIVELELPGRTGLEILKRYRVVLPPVVLALTNLADAPSMEEAAAAGVTCMIRIPCTGAEIAYRLDQR